MVDAVPVTHPDLRKQLAELELVHASILAYSPRTARPPVLDSSVDALPAPSQTLPGLRPFLESVLRDKDALAEVRPSRVKFNISCQYMHSSSS